MVKLDLGCGQRKKDGFEGVDYAAADGVDHVVNLFEFPWPWEDDSVDEVFASHFVEHIPHEMPGVDREGFWAFMDEVWRVCKPGATVEFIHPYAMSTRAFQDPTHHRFIPEATWYYLSNDWRKSQGLDHYKVACDFEVVTINGLGVDQSVQARSMEAQAFARQHYWHVIADLQVILKAKKA